MVNFPRVLFAAICVAAQSQCIAADPAPKPRTAKVARGLAVYQDLCINCHQIDKNGIGPMHRGVVGRSVGKAPGYAYSSALAGSKLVWTPVQLNRWLTDPEALIPGQKMGVKLADANDRSDVIAYLASVSSQRKKAVFEAK